MNKLRHNILDWVNKADVKGLPSRASSDTTWLDYLSITAITVIAIIIPILVGLYFHTLSIPHNDDWAFRLIAIHYFNTGHMSFNGWESMTLVGQVLWTSLFFLMFGVHQWVFSISVAVVGVFGLLTAYITIRRFLSTQGTTFCIFLLISCVGFFYNSTNYMTDLPSLSLCMICLYFGVRSIESDRHLRTFWMILSMLAGVAAFSIRDLYITAPIAVLISATFMFRKNWKVYSGLFLLIALICGAIYLWTSHLSGFVPEALHLPSTNSGLTTLRMVFTLSLFLTPVIATNVGTLLAHRRDKCVYLSFIGTLILGQLLLLQGSSLFFLGDYFQQSGILQQLVLPGTRPNLFPNFIWNTFIVISIIAAGCLISLIALHWKQFANKSSSLQAPLSPALLVVLFFTVLIVLETLILTLLGLASFDRFLWPLCLGISALILAFPIEVMPSNGIKHRSIGPTPVIAVIGLFVFSSLITLNSFSFDWACWEAGQTLVSAGIPPQKVDAGFEWVAFYAGRIHGKAFINAPSTGFVFLPNKSRNGSEWYDYIIPGPDLKAVVSSSPLASAEYQPVGTLDYRLFGLFGSSATLYEYRIIETSNSSSIGS